MKFCYPLLGLERENSEPVQLRQPITGFKKSQPLDMVAQTAAVKYFHKVHRDQHLLKLALNMAQDFRME